MTRLAILCTVLLWASSFSAIRRVLMEFPPHTMALLRFAIASSIFAGIMLLRGCKPPRRQDLPRILGGGFVGVTLYHCALNYGQQRVTAGSAGFLINTVPIFTTLLSVILLGERISAPHTAGITVSFLGISLITLGEQHHAPGATGTILILIAAVAQSAYFLLIRPLFQQYSPLEVTGYTLGSGTAFLGVFLPSLPADIHRASWTALGIVAYLAVFPAALASLAWTHVLSRYPASRAVSFLYLVPPLSLGVGWVWLGEIPSHVALVGCALSLTGVAISASCPRRPISSMTD